MIKWLAVLWLLLGALAAYKGLTTHDHTWTGAGIPVLLLSIGVLLNITIGGLLLAVFWATLLVITIVVALMKSVVTGRTIAQMAMHAFFAWTCFSWWRDNRRA